MVFANTVETKYIHVHVITGCGPCRILAEPDDLGFGRCPPAQGPARDTAEKPSVFMAHIYHEVIHGRGLLQQLSISPQQGRNALEETNISVPQGYIYPANRAPLWIAWRRADIF